MSGKRLGVRFGRLLVACVSVLLLVNLVVPAFSAAVEAGLDTLKVMDTAQPAEAVDAPETESADDLAGEDADEPEADAATDGEEATEDEPEPASDAVEATQPEEADEPESATDDAPAADAAEEQAGESEPATTADDGATILKAHAKGIRATLSVGASVELPEDAKLVVTPLVKHEAEADEAADDETKADEAAEDGQAEDESADLEAQDEESAAGEEPSEGEEPAEADDAEDTEAVEDTEGATDDTPAAETADAPESQTITGADVVLAGMSDAVQTYRAKKGAAAAAIVDAYAIEVQDAQGDLVQVPDDAATLTVTLEDDEDAPDYDKVYAVERDAEQDKPVSDAADTEYADEDAATEAIPYEATADDITDDMKKDEDSQEATVELDGVQSVVTTTEDADSTNGEAVDEEAGNTQGAATTKSVKASGPRKAPVTDSRPKKTTVDTASLGMVLNLFDYEASDINSQNTYSNPSYTGINEGKNNYNQLHFYASGTANDTDVTRNNLNQFTGQRQGGGNWSQQYANQGIVKSTLSGTRADDYADRYPELNTTNRYDSNNDKSTEYLFKPENVANKKTVYKNVNNLFYLDKADTIQERLVYNSNDAYAYYDVDQGDKGNFTVYDGTFDRANAGSDGMKVGFFPFDYPKNEWWNGTNPPEINATRANPPVNHHLGMTMSVPFTMPYNGVITNDKGSAPMEFEFSGDDDMWVFVDGKLVLDIGGIHQPVRGNINFKTGVIQLSSGTKVPKNDQGGNYAFTAVDINTATEADKLVRGSTVYLWNVYSGGTDANPNFVNNGSTPIHKGIFGDRDTSWLAGTTHTMQAFYLERGGCDSNLEISTNIHLMAKRQASIEKQWVDTADEDKQPVRVQLIRKAISRDTPKTIVGYAVVEEKTLSSASDWTQTWTDLVAEGYNPTTIYYNDKGEYNATTNPDGNRYCDYVYLVREVPLSGYTPTYYNSKDEKLPIEQVGKMNKAGVEVVETTGTGSTTVKISRTKTERGKTTSSPDTAYVSDDITLNEGDDWRYGIGDLDAYLLDDGAYYDYTYDLTQSNANVTVKQANYHLGEATGATDSAAIPSDFSTVIVKNEPIYLDVTKVWEDKDGNAEDYSLHVDDEVYVQLYKQVKAANGTWGDAQPVGSPVRLYNGNWTHSFKVSNDENVRYLVKEGASGSSFTEKRILPLGSNPTKTYVHDYTTYTRTGEVVNGDEEIDFSASMGDAEQLLYSWDVVVSGDDHQVTRTFAGSTELKQAGGARDTYDTDKISVVLTIPAAAEEIVDTTSGDYDYKATITLPAGLAAALSGEEGSQTWDVASSDVNASVSPNANGKTVSVTVDAATAKANKGKTITLSIPVKAADDGDLSSEFSSTAASIEVAQTVYQRQMFPGESMEMNDESTGGQYVTLPEGYTHADATIANKHVTTQLKVKKAWACDEPSESIWVQLYKDGVAMDSPVELKPTATSDNPKWTYTFKNLELGGVYTAKEGAYANGTFTAYTDSFELGTGANAKTYIQKSTVYYNADGTKRQTVTPADPNDSDSEETTTPIDNLDGNVTPDAGYVVITNGLAGADIAILKVDADSTTTAKATIQGAVFSLYADARAAGESDSADPVYTPAVDKLPTNLVKGDNDATSFTTDADGKIAFPSLQPGTYWLLETAAPAGYLVRDAAHPIGITVNDDGTVTLVADSYDTAKSRPTIGDEPDNGVYTITVPNLRTYALPATAGPGVLELVCLGAFAMTLALGLALRRRDGSDNRTGYRNNR